MNAPVTGFVEPWSPYRVDVFPMSLGRVMLGDLLTNYTLLEYGIGHPQIVEAFQPGGSEYDREMVIGAARFLGGCLLYGHFQSYGRPLGGGELVELDQHVWELDDFLPRFATCALDIRRPFDHASLPTHRIFVDAEAVQMVYDSCCSNLPLKPKIKRQTTKVTETPRQAEPGPTLAGETVLLSLREVMELVSFSRAKIYKMIGKGEFPPQRKISDSSVRWYRDEILAWIESQR